MSFDSDWDKISWFVFKGDVVKEEKVLFLIFKIFYFLAFLYILITFLVYMILSIGGYITTTRDISLWYMVALGFIEIIFIFTAIFVLRLVNRLHSADKSRPWIFVNQCLKVFFFILPTIIILFLTIERADWILTVPMFFICTIALVLTYPSRKRWENWMRNCPGSSNTE